jgi:NitT/TauT family transport system substrate-binding protein
MGRVGSVARRALVPAAVATLVSASLIGCSSNGSQAATAAAGGSTAITVSYSGLAPVTMPLWYAQDKGILAKNGLKVTMKNLSSTLNIPALISGQVQLSIVGGGEIVNAAAAGSKLKAVATLAPVYPEVFFSAPKMKKATDLIGQKVGVTSLTGTSASGAKAALKALGIDPSKVTLTTVGSVSNLQAALSSGAVAAGVVPLGSTTDKFVSLGFNKLYDLSKNSNVPYAAATVAVTDSYLSKSPTVINAFLKSMTEAIAAMKTDQSAAATILGKYLQTPSDTKGNSDTISVYSQEVFPAAPYPDVDQFQGAVDASKGSNAGVAKVDLTQIVDKDPLTKVMGK